MQPPHLLHRALIQAFFANWLAWLCLIIGILCGAGVVYFALRAV